MRELLQGYESSKVDVFIGYLNHLESEKDKDGKVKNWWYRNITKEQFANAFKKVAAGGLFLDGDSVTINYRKKLIITYDYHAYKNKVTIAYPDSIFDFQIVYDGDGFTFRKDNGKVYYSHKMNNPFQVKKKIVGAYGVIRNKRGEFIELLNVDDIDKMRNTSTMKAIWDNWFDRMVLKSIIKRICSVHFHDITKLIDDIDNETNEPERASIDDLIQKDIENAITEDELNQIYRDNISSMKDPEAFILMLTDRKNEIKTV